MNHLKIFLNSDYESFETIVILRFQYNYRFGTGL